ncbi:MAG TPA: flippase [Longimicrobiales bacterium]
MTTEVHGRILARNTALNLIGLGAPLLVALAAIPPVIRGLGEERFGVLAIAWMALGYLGELGVGRATTKFVAEALGAGDADGAAETAWTATAIQAGFGAACGVALAAATPVVVGRVLNIPTGLEGEARTALCMLAAALPLAIVSSSVRGMLEAAQRFDLVSAVRIPSTVANYVLPLAAIALGWRLPGAMALIVAARACTLLALYALAVRAVPALRGRPALRRARIPTLAGYGGWVSVSSLVSPLLVYLDRLALGILATMAAVAYYAAPYEIVNRLAILPASVVAALFPAVSALGGRADWERVRRLAAVALKGILLLVGPVAVALIGGAAELLSLWLGPDFARASAAALVILTLGVLANAAAHVPFALLQGVGRADVTAKFHLLELPIHVVLVWVLVGRWGIPGAALAWTLRTTLDAVLLFAAAGRIAGLTAGSLVDAGVARAAALVAGAGGLALAAAHVVPGPPLRAGALAVILAAMLLASWRLAMSDADRARLLGAVRAAGRG